MAETNAERLERIKQSESATDYLLGGTALKGDWSWLIEQAELANKPNGVAIYHNESIRLGKQNGSLRERVQDMKKEFADDIDFKRREVRGLQDENKRLCEALEKIDAIGTWVAYTDTATVERNEQAHIANEALEQLK